MPASAAVIRWRMRPERTLPTGCSMRSRAKRPPISKPGLTISRCSDMTKQSSYPGPNCTDMNELCVVFDIDDTLYLERDYVRSGFRAVGTWAEQWLRIPD